MATHRFALLCRAAFQVLRSVFLALCQLVWRHGPPVCTDFPTLSVPIVLIPGLMSLDCQLKETVVALRARGVNVHAARLGPVSSNHDRACELFYALKGGRVDFGAEHSARHGHSRFGRSHADGLVADWDEEHPIILITHSQGAGTALVLQHLLAAGDFFGPQHARWLEMAPALGDDSAPAARPASLTAQGVPEVPPGPPMSPSKSSAIRSLHSQANRHATTAGWVQAIVSIAAPLNGSRPPPPPFIAFTLNSLRPRPHSHPHIHCRIFALTFTRARTRVRSRTLTLANPDQHYPDLTFAADAAPRPAQAWPTSTTPPGARRSPHPPRRIARRRPSSSAAPGRLASGSS